MNALYESYNDFLREHVLIPFYQKRLESLKKLKMEDVLKRKNPYLFKAKNIEISGDLVKGIIDAFLSSQEETTFGNLLETFAIFVSQQSDQGFKSKLKSIDLEFQRDGIYYIVGIKSGTNWGNADQINAMIGNFKQAKAKLRADGVAGKIIAVNGCMYGTEAHPRKSPGQGKAVTPTVLDPDELYYKYAGQDFWAFLSGDDHLYREIIKPFDQEARLKDEEFKRAYNAKVHEFDSEFMAKFLTPEKQIDWMKLIDFVSKRQV
jgi:hypothetical protein